jgi:hypothetical protein
VVAAALTGLGIGAVDDPVFFAVGRLEEAVVAGAEGGGGGIGAEEGVVDLGPTPGVGWVGRGFGFEGAEGGWPCRGKERVSCSKDEIVGWVGFGDESGGASDGAGAG